ncbi:MAG: MFS transporter, partial [Alphaproteobacteria bacterium]|nr:MFS transporter [Alphaproteobacteria bacterium]
MRRYVLVLTAGALVMSLAMGIRQAFGVMVAPYSAIHGWPLATFSLALASQNLLWGMAQPFAAAAAEKWGARRVGALGGL